MIKAEGTAGGTIPEDQQVQDGDPEKCDENWK